MLPFLSISLPYHPRIYSEEEWQHIQRHNKPKSLLISYSIVYDTDIAITYSCSIPKMAPLLFVSTRNHPSICFQKEFEILNRMDKTYYR